MYQPLRRPSRKQSAPYDPSAAPSRDPAKAVKHAKQSVRFQPNQTRGASRTRKQSPTSSHALLHRTSQLATCIVITYTVLSPRTPTQAAGDMAPNLDSIASEGVRFTDFHVGRCISVVCNQTSSIHTNHLPHTHEAFIAFHPPIGVDEAS